MEEFEKVMSFPLEALGFWTIQRDRAQEEIDKIKDKISEEFHGEHDCGSYMGDACTVCYRYAEVFGLPEPTRYGEEE